MNHGKVLHIIRAAKGLSQQELAKKTGLSKSLLSRVEANKRNLSSKSKKLIAEKLKIPLKLIDLLTIEDSQKVNQKKIEEIGKALLCLISE